MQWKRSLIMRLEHQLHEVRHGIRSTPHFQYGGGDGDVPKDVKARQADGGLGLHTIQALQ